MCIDIVSVIVLLACTLHVEGKCVATLVINLTKQDSESVKIE